MDVKAADERVVRIFVSSTFLDFEPEREALAVHVWPELRRRASERFAHVVAIDLQWGVSSAEARENKQLERCIREIDGCGVFLGLLGARYGWMPPHEAFTAPILQDRPWLEGHLGKSKTELEVLCGCLDPATPNTQAVIFVRGQLAPEYQPLVQNLRAHGVVVHSITDIESFVRSATELLWAQINCNFPPERVSRSTDEQRRHRAFGADRSWAIGSEYGDGGNQHFDAYLGVCLRGGAAPFGGPMRRSFAVHAPTAWDAIALCGYIAREAHKRAGAAVFEHYPPAGQGSDADTDFLEHVARFSALLLGHDEPTKSASVATAIDACDELSRWKARSGKELFLLLAGVEALSSKVKPVVEHMALSMGGLCIVYAEDGSWQTAVSEWGLPWTFMNFASDNFIYFVRRYIERYGKAMDQKPFYDLAQKLDSHSLLHHKQICDFLIRFARFSDVRAEIDEVVRLTKAAQGDVDQKAAARCQYFANRARERIGAEPIDNLLAVLVAAPNGGTEEEFLGRSELSLADFARAKSGLGFALDEWRDRLWLCRGLGDIEGLLRDAEKQTPFPSF